MVNTFVQLAPELISLIFCHLNHHDLYHCILVNRSFHHQSIPLLWRHLAIDNRNTLMAMIDTMATSSHSPGNHVRIISVTCLLTDPNLLGLTKYSPWLEQLTLKRAQFITDTSFRSVARHCPHLTTLAIHQGIALTQTVMTPVLTRLSLIRVVTLTDCHSLEPVSLWQALAAACPHVRHLTIFQCASLLAPPVFPDTTMTQIASTVVHLPHLTCLRIQDPTNDYTRLITMAITRTTWLRHLTHLALSACRTLDDTLATTFLSMHGHQLRSLALGYTAITDVTLDAIVRCCPRIRDVRVPYARGLTSTGLERFVNSCSTLVHGVRCAGCEIDVDSIDNLDQYTYDLAFADDGFEVIWLAGEAYANWDGEDDNEECCGE